MRIGISLIEPAPDTDVFGELRTQLEQAATAGFASAWISNIFGLDALTTLAVIGNQVPGIEVGTAVVPTYPRHPVTLAQQALTVQTAIDGQLALGIGLSHQIVIENMFGYSFDKPARHMREYLSILLPLLDEGTVSFEGETMRANITLSTPRVHKVPVLLAALAPHMLHLAGARAAGTALWMTGPATIKNHVVPTITAAAEEAGRPPPRVVCVLPICVSDDIDAARARADAVFAIYGQLPSYRAMLDKEGAAGPADVAIIGDEAAVDQQIEQLAAAGATDFIAAEYASGEDKTRTRAYLTALAARHHT